MSAMTRQLEFQGTHSALLLCLHLGAVGLTLFLIVLLLRYERQLVSRTVGNWLIGLRIAVLATILMTLMQPVLSWTLDEKRTGRILVGIDLSESMGTTDVHARRAEKLRWARGLGMIGNAAINARLDRWQKSLDEQGEPDWVAPDETADEARRAALVETRRSQLNGIFRELDALSRKEVARRLLTTTPQPLLTELERLARVELYSFAGKTEAAEREQLEQIVQSPSQSLLPGTTDLAAALQVSGSDVMGMILLTDGRDHSGKDLGPLAASLKALGVPIYPVLIGSTFRPRDLSIVSLEAPQMVYKGDHPKLKVVLSTVGFEGRTLDVELVPDGDPEAEPIRKSVKVTGASATLEFDLDSTDVGRKAFLVRTPVLEGETRDDNNIRTFAFAVVDDRARVLLVDGDARWEFRYLSAALTRDERVDLKQVLVRQPYLGVLPEPFFPQSLQPPGGADAQNPFADVDLIILGDVEPAVLNDRLFVDLQTFVSEGGTLVLSAGKRYLPQAYRSAILDQLLPLVNLRMVQLSDPTRDGPPTQRGLPLQLTVDGELQAALQFALDPFENQRVWKSLPGQMWALLGDPKPGATVWATTILPAELADPLMADRQHGMIVHQHVGSGQVLWMGFDGTWRWRHRAGDSYHHRFWGQLARWAATNKATAGNEFVRFGPERTDIELGEEAVFRARWMAPFLQRFPRLKGRIQFFRVGKDETRPFTEIGLAASPAGPLIHEGRAASLPAGEYRAVLKVDDADLGQKPVEATLYVHDKPSQELSELAANRDLLTQLADASGGRLFQIDELSELPRQFKTFDGTVSKYEESPLWDRWPWLVLLCGLLTTEWVIRKMNGLP